MCGEKWSWEASGGSEPKWSEIELVECDGKCDTDEESKSEKVKG
jgi:hypothetical protein